MAAALILQGCAVLVSVTFIDATPPPGHVPTPIDDKNPPKYEYGYVVSDKEGAQGHVESRDGIFALGKYYVNLPDGNEQKVTYFADDWGYHPLVSYTSTTATGSSRTTFAMGDKAMGALKDLSPTIPTNPNPTASLASGVQVVNAGASGHSQPPVEVPTVAPVTITTASPTVSSSAAQSVVSLLPAIATQESHTVSSSSSAAAAAAAAAAVTGVTGVTGVSGAGVSVQQSLSPLIHYVTPTVQTATYSNSPVVLQTGIVNTQQQLPVVQSTVLTQGEQISQLQNELKKESVQIVTPSVNEHFETYVPINLIDNSISPNDTSDTERFTHQGQNIQITSYLADTNKVLYYGDRIGVKEQEDSEEQRLINEIQEHAKQRIFKDLQEQTLKKEFVSVSTTPATYTTASLRPIVVTGSDSLDYSISSLDASSTLAPDLAQPGDYRVVSSSDGQSGYNSGVGATGGSGVLFSTQAVSVLQSETPTVDLVPTAQPLIDAKFTTASSISTVSSSSLAEKSDYAEQISNVHSGNTIHITPRPNELQDQLASLQVAASLLSGPEAQYPSPTVAPVKEENTEDITQGKTIVEIEKGLSLDIPQTGGAGPYEQNRVGQNQPIQGLGYERRLVNPEAQDVVQEQNPLIREQKAENLLAKQELELQQVQQSLQDLQQKIINDIDAHHEEEQRKQEQVNEERSKHFENLQRVETLTKDQEVIRHSGNTLQSVSPFSQINVSPTIVYASAAGPQYQTESNNAYQQHQTVTGGSNIIEDNSGPESEYQGSHVQEGHITESVRGDHLQINNQRHIANEIVVDGNHNYVVSDQRLPEVGPTQASPVLVESGNLLPPYSVQQTVEHSGAQSYVVHEGNQVEVQQIAVPPPPSPSVIPIEVEKPVISNPSVIETTKIVEIEKPIIVKEPVPIEQTKVVEVEKPVTLLQPYPVEVTKVVHVDRPVAVPTPYAVAQPIPIPFAVPHAVNIPVPHLIPYPEILPLPYKEYHPIYIHKYSPMKPSKRLPDQVFKEAARELYEQSHTYHTIPLHLKLAPKHHHHKSHHSEYNRSHYKGYHPHSGRNKNALKNLRIEYGFKPPLIPSAEIKEEPKPSIYGPSVRPE